MEDYKIIIQETVNKIYNEEIFKDIDKKKILDYLYSKEHLLSGINKNELYIRIEKIMAIEVLYHIFDDLSPEEVNNILGNIKKNDQWKTIYTIRV